MVLHKSTSKKNKQYEGQNILENSGTELQELFKTLQKSGITKVITLIGKEEEKNKTRSMGFIIW